MKKKKPITKTKAKQKAWSAFSLYVRMKACGLNEYANCYTCGARKHYKQLQAGHAIAGRNNAVLFEEDLVRVQDVGCNIFGRGKQAEFTFKLIKELGMTRYEQLVERSRFPVQYKTQDYLDIEALYKQKLSEL